MMRRYLFIFLTLTCLLGSVALPQPVYALTQSRIIDSQGTLNQLIYSGGAGDYTNLNSDDGDTSYAIANATGMYSGSFNMQDFTESVSSIGSVTLYAKLTSVDSVSSAYLLCYIGSTSYLSDVINPIGYALYSKTWTTNPATGMAWTATAINNAQFGVKLNRGATNVARCSYLYLVVTYTPASAPTMSTDSASGISYTGGGHVATLNGEIDDDGGISPTERGFVYGLTSNSTTPGNETPPASYTANWTEGGSFSEGTFSYQLTGLMLCTTYYYRAFAMNSEGYSYGAEASFTTLCNPSMTTGAATYVTTTTARLNASVITNGGQLADVRFCYGTTSGNCTYGSNCTLYSCNCTMYDTSSTWVENTYTIGSTPYLDVSGLTANTTYYFCSQIRNDVDCFCGGQLSFTTESGLDEPSDFIGIAAPRSISLAWVKSSGATRTLIRYKLGSYPTSIADGTQVYFDTQTSYLFEGLVPGTTYYFMAWGESGGTYSTGNTTLMMTTLPAVAGDDDLPLPTTPSLWFSAPDYTNMENMPFYSIVNFFSDSFEIPRSTTWYWLALATCVAIGILVYTTIGNYNLVMTIFTVAVCLVIASFMQLIPFWHLVPFGVFAAVGIFVGERR